MRLWHYQSAKVTPSYSPPLALLFKRCWLHQYTKSCVNNLLLSFNATTSLHFHHIGLFYRFHLLHRYRFHRPVQYCLRVGPVQLHRITLVFIIVRSCCASIAATPHSAPQLLRFLPVSCSLRTFIAIVSTHNIRYTPKPCLLGYFDVF